MKIKKVLLSAIATLCLTSGMWSQTVIPAYVPTNSLVGWWPFNGNANDLSVNANNGNINTISSTIDRFNDPNKAYHFNNSGSISVPTLTFQTFLNTGFTISY